MSDSTLVVKEGVTYGTAVTPDRTFRMLPKGDSLDYDPDYSWSAAHCWGKRGPAAAGRVLLSRGAKGGVELELSSLGFGFWWKMCLGTITNTQIGATSVYQQVHTLGGSQPFFCAQKLVQSVSDAGVFTTEPQTYNSLVVSSWELTIPESGIATLKVVTVGKDVVTSTAAVTPAACSASDHLLHSGGATLSTGTLVAPTTTALATATTALSGVRSLTIKGDNDLITRRSGWGTFRPVPGREPSIKGDIELDYVTGSPWVPALMAGTPLALLAGLAALENADELTQVVIPSLLLEGELPKAGSPSELQTIKVPFTAARGTDANLIYVVNRTYDVTP